VGIAPGAYAGVMYAAFHQTGPGQLMATDAPKIEMVRTHAKGPELSGNLGFVVDELGATGTQRRADGRAHLPWIATEFGSHPQDGIADDAGHTAPPAAVDVGHDTFLRIEKHHCLTVRG